MLYLKLIFFKLKSFKTLKIINKHSIQMLTNPDGNENKKCLETIKAFFIVMDSRNRVLR